MAAILGILCTEIRRHNFNDEIGDGKVFDGWERVEHKWEWYAHEVFGGEEVNGDSSEDEATGPRRRSTKGQHHPRITLPTDENGMPSIPIILNMNGQEKKDVLRAFISFHYGMYIISLDKRLTFGVQERLVGTPMYLCPGQQLQLTEAHTFRAGIGPKMSHSRSPPGLQIQRSH